MIHNKDERGQALILIAFAAIGLFAFAALAIDGSRSFSNKRHAQNTADTAVLTAALVDIRTSGDADAKFDAAEAAAILRAESNGYVDDNGVTTIVDVDRCDDVRDYDAGGNLIPIPGDVDASGNPIPCEGIGSAPAAEFIRVKIISSIPTTFGRVVGRDTLTSAVEAIARVEGSSSSSKGTLISGAAMFATSQDPADNAACYRVQGGSVVHTWDSGIYVNCPSRTAVEYQSGSGGGGSLTLDGPSPIAGCIETYGQAEKPANLECYKKTAQDFESYFESLPTKPETPNCNGLADKTSTTVFPAGSALTEGKYSNITITGDVTIQPGRYCVSGSVSSVGSPIVTQSGSGAVQFIMGGLFTTKKATYNMTNIEVYTQDSNLEIGQDGTLNATRLRYYSSGTGEFSIKNKAHINSGNAYMYLQEGKYDPDAGGFVNLTAPKPPDIHAGIIVFMPWDNHKEVTINGGANTYMKGSFVAPGSLITLNGNTEFELWCQFIGSKFKITGGGTANIHYDATSSWPPPNVQTPTIKLTK